MADLDLAYAALRMSLGSDEALTIRQLPEGQLFIAKNLVPAPGSHGAKTPRLTPGKGGYSIHVRATRSDVESMLAQRPSDGVEPPAWDGDSIAARHARLSLDQQWAIERRDGVRFAVSVRCGSSAVLDEAERVLATVGRVLSEY